MGESVAESAPFPPGRSSIPAAKDAASAAGVGADVRFGKWQGARGAF
jgi:hypothetical protein